MQTTTAQLAIMAYQLTPHQDYCRPIYFALTVKKPLDKSTHDIM